MKEIGHFIPQSKGTSLLFNRLSNDVFSLGNIFKGKVELCVHVHSKNNNSKVCNKCIIKNLINI